MGDNRAAVRIKIGAIELEYEGDPEFLNGGIEMLLKTVGSIAASTPSSLVEKPTSQTNGGGAPKPTTSTPSEFTTATLAAQASVKTAKDLILCAMATLEIGKQQSPNDSRTILREMQTASAYYQQNMSGHNSSNLKSLVRDKKINESASGKYALTNSERSRLEGLIAAID